jgi:plasmid stabilization system protein ParE
VSRTVVIRPEAETDLAAARDWYEDRMAGLGAEFGREVDLVLSAAAERALGFPVIHRDVRRALIKRFPYGVFFVASEDLVVVLAVLHQARDPAVWKRRA